MQCSCCRHGGRAPSVVHRIARLVLVVCVRNAGGSERDDRRGGGGAGLVLCKARGLPFPVPCRHVQQSGARQTARSWGLAKHCVRQAQVFFGPQSLCLVHTGQPTGVAVSHCTTRFQTQPILTVCQIRYRGHCGIIVALDSSETSFPEVISSTVT